MILYPKLYINNILEIDEKIIKENNIHAILLDIDNTIMYYNRELVEGIEEWARRIKNLEIKMCILSNSNHIEKAQKAATILDIPYIYFANKPFKKGFKKALKIVNEKPENVAMVGDQIMTDVLGANRMKMFSILTKPLEEKDIWVTKIKRPIEQGIIKKYLKRREKINVSK